MDLAVDHLILCAADLEEAADRLFRDGGLASLPGGRHPGHGTANRIVPLGNCYLELLTVVDPDEAGESSFGRWATQRLDPPVRVDGLCFRTDDLGSIAGRLGLEPVAMSRETPDGGRLSWRLVGMERLVEDGLPFFIEWGVSDDELPGRSRAGHDVEVLGVDVTLSGDLGGLGSLLGEAVNVVPGSGRPAVEATILTGRGPVTI